MGVSLIYNIVLALDVEKSESVLHISLLFSHVDSYRTLSRLPLGPCWVSPLTYECA